MTVYLTVYQDRQIYKSLAQWAIRATVRTGQHHRFGMIGSLRANAVSLVLLRSGSSVG